MPTRSATGSSSPRTAEVTCWHSQRGHGGARFLAEDSSAESGVFHTAVHVSVLIGAGDEVAMARGTVQIVVERCKACGFCVEFCPTKVLALSSAFNSKGYHPPHVVAPEKCSGCDLCGMYCPDFAIFGARHAR